VDLHFGRRFTYREMNDRFDRLAGWLAAERQIRTATVSPFWRIIPPASTRSCSRAESEANSRENRGMSAYGMTAFGAKRPFIRKRDLVSTTNEYKTIQFPTGKEIAKPCQSAQARAGRSPRGIRGILDGMKNTPFRLNQVSQTAAEDVCYRRKSGKYLLVPGISQFDLKPTSAPAAGAM
jgi:hypothetical protein